MEVNTTRRSFNEIIEAAMKSTKERIPIYLEEKRQAEKLKKYSYKKNLKSRKK